MGGGQVTTDDFVLISESSSSLSDMEPLQIRTSPLDEYPSTAALLLETGSVIHRQYPVLRNRLLLLRGELVVVENVQYPGRFFLIWQCSPANPPSQSSHAHGNANSSGSSTDDSHGSNSSKCLEDLATEYVICDSVVPPSATMAASTMNSNHHGENFSSTFASSAGHYYQEWVVEIARIHSFQKFIPRIGSPLLGSGATGESLFPFLVINEKGSLSSTPVEQFYFEHGSAAMTEFTNYFDRNLVPLRKNFDSTPMIDGNLGVEVILDFSSGVGSVSRYLIEQEESNWEDTHILIGKMPPLQADRWKRFLQNASQENGINSVTEIEEIKKIIYAGGISPDIRLQVWKYLLGIYPWTDTASDEKRALIDARKLRDYAAVKSLWYPLLNDPALRPAIEKNEKVRERIARIDKDVTRTERHATCFRDDDAPFLTILRNVLISYSMWNFDLGYCQGMNDCLCEFFFLADERDPTIANNKVSPAHETCQRLEAEVFWMFSGLMEIIGKNFLKDGSGIAAQLAEIRNIVGKVDPQLFSVLESKSPQKRAPSDPGWEICVFRGLLLWWRRELADAGQVARLWEACWSGHLTKNFHLFFAAAALIKSRQELMLPEVVFDELLKLTNEMAGKIDLNETLVLTEQIFRRYQTIVALESNAHHAKRTKAL